MTSETVFPGAVDPFPSEATFNVAAHTLADMDGSGNNHAYFLRLLGSAMVALETQFEVSAEHLNIESVDQGSLAFDVNVDTGHVDGPRSRFTVENNPASQHVDINFRGASVNVGSLDPDVSAAGTALLFFGPLGDTSHPISVYKAGDGTLGTNTFRVGRNGDVAIACGGLATNALGVKVAADAQNRFDITEFGALEWGPGGSTAPDTNLYRDSANTLKTDDTLVVGPYISLAASNGVISTDGFVNINQGRIDFVEGSDPSAPSANRASLYSRDNGSSKTQLVVRFPTGAIQVIATEP